jgi:hypothetical protein
MTAAAMIASAHAATVCDRIESGDYSATMITRRRVGMTLTRARPTLANAARAVITWAPRFG